MSKKKESAAQTGTKDLRHEFVAPDPRFQARRSYSASKASGSVELGWYRGHQSGVHDAYKTIRRKFPEAAAAILYEFNMNRDGSMGIRPRVRKPRKRK